jgi:murein L,D-transpeptidase YafK
LKKLRKLKDLKIGPINLSEYINKGVARNILFMTFAILLFFFGVVIYGVILNLRQVELTEAIYQKGFSELNNTNIVIDRSNYTLSLYEDSVFIKSYRASFGKTTHSEKIKANDGATPVGEYKICNIDTAHIYYKFLQINYPNLNDATDALRKGWISQKEFNDIKFQFYYEGCTKYNRVLGGNVGIHGVGNFNFIFKNLPFVFNWTNGSIAISNEDLNEIFSVIKVGTKVVIK